MSELVVAVLVVAPVGNHYGALLADSLVWQGWTPFKQRVMNLAGIDNCGLLDEVDVVVDAVAAGGVVTGPGGVAGGPFGLPVFPLTGSGESVTFDVSGVEGDVVFWVRAVDGVEEVTIELVDSEGQIEIYSPPNRGGRGPGGFAVWFVDSDYWSLAVVPNRKMWREIRVGGLANSFGGSDVLVSQPAVAEFVGAGEVVSGSTVLAGPSKSTYVSCADEPRKVDGRWGGIDYVLVTNWGKPYGYEKVVGEQVEIGFSRARGSFMSLIAVNRVS